MATTSIWKVESRLDQVINYTTNKEKTDYSNSELYKSLHNVIDYTTNDFKTEERIFVTGINCDEENAYNEMIATKERYGKMSGILAYHGFQSFKEGEVSAKKAHEIGVKLADELWGEKYEVVVSTHLNTKHLHNHFVLNSVSFYTGEKYRNTRENYALMRKTSDEICKEYGLSVLDEKICGRHNIDYTKYYNSYIQKNDYYTILKEDIDFAIKNVSSYKEFETLLEKMGYVVTIRANKISLNRPPHKRNVRIERAFGEEYSIESIKERIKYFDSKRIPFPENNSSFRRFRLKKGNIKYIKTDKGSIYRLYLYYKYLIKSHSSNNKRVKLTENMKKESRKLDEMSSEIKFICKYNIKNTGELLLYKQDLIKELNSKFKVRQSLRNKKGKERDDNKKKKLYEEILKVSDQIKILKSDIKKCENIEKRSLKMKQNLKEVNSNEIAIGKERSNNEYSR